MHAGVRGSHTFSDSLLERECQSVCGWLHTDSGLGKADTWLTASCVIVAKERCRYAAPEEFIRRAAGRWIKPCLGDGVP